MSRERLPERWERSTRGKRLKQALDEEEDQADTAFWNQEFFKEEVADDDYKTESEPEDQIDTDFDDDEDDDDDDEVVVKDDEPRKKALKPPGYKPAKPKPQPKAKPKPKPKDDDDEYMDEEEGDEDDEEEGDDGEARAPRPKPAKAPREPIAYVAPTLRRSTVARVAEAQRERQYKVSTKTPRRRGPGSGSSNWRPLTQSELLAEAALNEIENTRSLKALLAQEEETKRRAQVVKKKNTGPSIKFLTKKGANGEEHTTLELVNTFYPPPWMAPSHAPPPPDKSVCPITGLPARYRDPASNTPFANTLAFKRLRTGAGPLGPSMQQQLVMHHHMEEAVRQQQKQGGLAALAAQGRQVGLGGVALVGQVVEQQQRRAQLEERARALAAAAADPRMVDPVPLVATLDVMALVVDVRRTLQAAA